MVIPRYIITHPPASSPWLERYRVRLAHGIATVDALLAPREVSLPRADVSTVMQAACAAKLDDAYHSTTIEGYSVTRDEVRAVITGRAYQGRTPEEIEYSPDQFSERRSKQPKLSDPFDIPLA